MQLTALLLHLLLSLSWMHPRGAALCLDGRGQLDPNGDCHVSTSLDPDGRGQLDPNG